MKETAHVAYDAYRMALGIDLGHPINDWASLPESIRAAWRAAINAVLPDVNGN